MFGIIIIFIAVIGKIMQVNNWFVIPNEMIVGAFVFGAIMIFIQIVVSLLIGRKMKRLKDEISEDFKDFDKEFHQLHRF